MAYLHCHNCDWGQDDFYSFQVNWKNILRWKRSPFGYNPVSKVMETIACNIKPRMIDWDPNFVKYDAPELIKSTGIKVKFYKKTENIVYGVNDIKQTDQYGNMRTTRIRYYCFSWSWLLLDIVSIIKTAKHTKWWTYKGFKADKDRGKARCPKCGSDKHFDID